jgi:hypothetical protein
MRRAHGINSYLIDLGVIAMWRLGIVPIQVSSEFHQSAPFCQPRDLSLKTCLSSSLSFWSLRTSDGGGKVNVPTSLGPCFFFFSKEAGGYGNIREAREGNEIKMKSIERRKAHFWLLHRQTNELQ